jgi:hypothetical protein
MPPATEQTFSDGCGNSTTVHGVVKYEMRRTKRKKDSRILSWERPAQKKLGNGDRVFANGQLVSRT